MFNTMARQENKLPWSTVHVHEIRLTLQVSKVTNINFLPTIINTQSRELVVRINEIITQEKISNSLNLLFMKIDQFGEFACGYWGLKG